MHIARLACLLALITSLSPARAIAQSGVTGLADFPFELQAPYAAFLHAKPKDKDAACNDLIDAYLPLIRAGKDIPSADKTIVNYLSVESRANLAARLSIAGVFSAGRGGHRGQRCAGAHRTAGRLRGIGRQAVRGFEDLIEKRLAFARRVGPGCKGPPRRLAVLPFASQRGQLETALRESGDKRGLFEFKAYRYRDESKPNPFRFAGLFFKWLFLPDRKRFGDEMAAVDMLIKDDMRRTSPAVAGLPRLGGEIFSTGAGETMLLSFTDPGSPLYGKRAVVAFFDTTCAYCFDELKALGRLTPRYDTKSQGRLAIIGVKTPGMLPPPLGALAPFEKAVEAPFPLLENDASRMSQAYEVRFVPLLIFFDERGFPLWTVSVRGQGNLERKLSWFLDDFLADARPAIPVAAGPASPKIIVDYYADLSDPQAREFLDTAIPALIRSPDPGVEVAPHDTRTAAVAEALEDRLAALRIIRSDTVVAIVQGKVFQGVAEVKRGLPEAIMIGSRQPAAAFDD